VYENSCKGERSDTLVGFCLGVNGAGSPTIEMRAYFGLDRYTSNIFRRTSVSKSYGMSRAALYMMYLIVLLLLCAYRTEQSLIQTQTPDLQHSFHQHLTIRVPERSQMS